jgi:hypothetical protein
LRANSTAPPTTAAMTRGRRRLTVVSWSDTASDVGSRSREPRTARNPEM